MSSAPTGLVKALVTNNADPAHKARVKVRIPGVLGTHESEWALPTSPQPRKPRVNEVVFVMFVDGDFAQPVWISGAPVADPFTWQNVDWNDFLGNLPDEIIATEKIANDAITAGKLAAEAVDAAAIQAAAVTAAKLANGAVTTVAIADQAIDIAKLADGSVDASKILAGAVGLSQIADGSITDVKVATDAITAPKIQAGAIVAGKIAANAVGANEIAANSIVSGKIAADAVTANNIQASSIDASKMVTGTITAVSGIIADAAITTAKIADLAVNTAKIANLAVGTAQIGDAAIVTAKIGDAQILSAKIAAAQIQTAHIQNAQITNALIADAAINRAKIQDAEIVTAKIGDAAITTAKIADANITTAKIANLAVTSAQIADATITSAKIGTAQIKTANIDTLAVTSAQIADLAVTTLKIGDLQITANKLNDLAVTTTKLDNLAVTTTKLSDAAITTAKIGDAQITSAKVVSLVADKITSGSLTATLDVTSGLIRTAASGARAQMDSTGFHVYGTDGVTKTFDADSSGNVTVTGTIQSTNFVSGSTGWRLLSTGAAELSAVTIRGELYTSTSGPRVHIGNAAPFGPGVEFITNATASHASFISASDTATAETLVIRSADLTGTNAGYVEVDFTSVYDDTAHHPGVKISCNGSSTNGLFTVSNEVQTQFYGWVICEDLLTVRGGLTVSGGTTALLGTNVTGTLTTTVDVVAASQIWGVQARIGDQSTTNTVLNGNHLYARNAATNNGTLYLNWGIGQVNIGGKCSINDDFDVNGRIDHIPNTGTASLTASFVLISGSTYRLRLTTSSRRFKDNIQPLDLDVEKVLSLEPKIFQRNDTMDDDGNTVPVTDQTPWEVGFIAEEAHGAGLDQWVIQDADQAPFGFSYQTWVVAQQLVLRDLAARVKQLETAAQGG